MVRRKARGVTLHARSPAFRARPGATHSRAGLAKSRPCALWRAIPLDLRGRRKEECGRPPGPEPQTGADFLLTQRNAQSCRVGQGVGRAFNANKRLSCAVPTRPQIEADRTTMRGHGAREVSRHRKAVPNAFAHPTISLGSRLRGRALCQNKTNRGKNWRGPGGRPARPPRISADL